MRVTWQLTNDALTRAPQNSPLGKVMKIISDISANSTKNDHLNANKVVHKQNYGDLYEFQTLERVWKQFACKPPTHIIIKLLSSFEWRKQNNTLSLEWLMAPEQYQVNLTPTISGLKKWGNLAELHHF